MMISSSPSSTEYTLTPFAWGAASPKSNLHHCHAGGHGVAFSPSFGYRKCGLQFRSARRVAVRVGVVGGGRRESTVLQYTLPWFSPANLPTGLRGQCPLAGCWDNQKCGFKDGCNWSLKVRMGVFSGGTPCVAPYTPPPPRFL